MNLRERIKKIKLVAFDFDGVFTDNAVYVDEDGKESVRCWRGDGIGLRKLEKLGVKTVVISSESNPVVAHRCAKMHIQCSCGIRDKLSRLKEIEPDLSCVAYVGNDINDLECLKAVGVPIVVNDASPNVKLKDAYITTARGGHGAVREICDWIDYEKSV